MRSAAHSARKTIEVKRTGEVFYFRHRDAPEHHEVLLPEGAPERFGRAGELWNAEEAAERRKDAQVAREMVLALHRCHNPTSGKTAPAGVSSG